MVCIELNGTKSGWRIRIYQYESYLSSIFLIALLFSLIMIRYHYLGKLKMIIKQNVSNRLLNRKNKG